MSRNPDKKKIYFHGVKITGDPIVHYDYGKDRFTLLIPETNSH